MKKTIGQAHKLNVFRFQMIGDVVVTNGFVGKGCTICCHAVAVVKIQDTFPETPKYAQLINQSVTINNNNKKNNSNSID